MGPGRRRERGVRPAEEDAEPATDETRLCWKHLSLRKRKHIELQGAPASVAIELRRAEEERGREAPKKRSEVWKKRVATSPSLAFLWCR